MCIRDSSEAESLPAVPGEGPFAPGACENGDVAEGKTCTLRGSLAVLRGVFTRAALRVNVDRLLEAFGRRKI